MGLMPRSLKLYIIGLVSASAVAFIGTRLYFHGDPNIGTRYGYQALPSIHIIVKNGHVTLEGVVDNQFDKTLINTRANSVPNVFSVTNNLQVVSNKEK